MQTKTMKEADKAFPFLRILGLQSATGFGRCSG